MTIRINQAIVEKLNKMGWCVWWRYIFRCVCIVIHIVSSVEVRDDRLSLSMFFVGW